MGTIKGIMKMFTLRYVCTANFLSRTQKRHVSDMFGSYTEDSLSRHKPILSTGSVMRNFATTISFYEMHTVRHLWSNLQNCKLFYGKKILNVTTVKLFPKIKKSIF